MKERELFALEQVRKLRVQLLEEQTKASEVEQKLRLSLTDKERQISDQKELVKQCTVQIDQFDALNRLRDELIDALTRENRDFKE